MSRFLGHPQQAMEWIENNVPELAEVIDNIRVIANDFNCAIHEVGLTSMILIAESDPHMGSRSMVANMVMINLDGLELYSFSREGNFDDKYYIVIGLPKVSFNL